MSKPTNVYHIGGDANDFGVHQDTGVLTHSQGFVFEELSGATGAPTSTPLRHLSVDQQPAAVIGSAGDVMHSSAQQDPFLSTQDA